MSTTFNLNLICECIVASKEPKMIQIGLVIYEKHEPILCTRLGGYVTYLVKSLIFILDQ